MGGRLWRAGNAPAPARLLEAQLPILELQYVDETGSRAAVTMKYPLGTTLDIMEADGALLASLIAPLTGCALIRQRAIFKTVASPRDVPDVGSLITRRGVFYFASDDETSLAIVEVPGLLDEMLESSGTGEGVVIDQSNGYISTLIATIIETPITDPFGNLMSHIIAAYLQSRVQ